MKNRVQIVWLCSLVCFLIFSVILFLKYYHFSSNTVEVDIHGAHFVLEVADNNVEWKKGLSGRESIPADGGMAFVFPQSGRHQFWMKGMRIPIDFVWIDAGRVVDLSQNVPPVGAGIPESSIPIVTSQSTVDVVLEIPAGTIAKQGISIGDKVDIIGR